MKKVLVSMTAVVAIFMMARERKRMCVSVKISDDLVIQNIEALADGEVLEPMCIGEGSVLCPNGEWVYTVLHSKQLWER